MFDSPFASCGSSSFPPARCPPLPLPHLVSSFFFFIVSFSSFLLFLSFLCIFIFFLSVCASSLPPPFPSFFRLFVLRCSFFISSRLPSLSPSLCLSCSVQIHCRRFNLRDSSFSSYSQQQWGDFVLRLWTEKEEMLARYYPAPQTNPDGVCSSSSTAAAPVLLFDSLVQITLLRVRHPLLILLLHSHHLSSSSSSSSSSLLSSTSASLLRSPDLDSPAAKEALAFSQKFHAPLLPGPYHPSSLCSPLVYVRVWFALFSTSAVILCGIALLWISSWLRIYFLIGVVTVAIVIYGSVGFERLLPFARRSSSSSSS